MDSLIAASLHSTAPTGQSTPAAGLKSGNQTPAPATKVLRWKDLEARMTASEAGNPGTQTPIILPTEDRLGGFETRSDGDDSDIEDLFV
jgi:hypothetical protein